MNTLVKNLSGTGQLTCRCGSWIKHWENFTRQKAYLCSATDCRTPADRGGHVIKQNSVDRQHYIVPLCVACNNRTDTFNISATLVSANVQATCG